MTLQARLLQPAQTFSIFGFRSSMQGPVKIIRTDILHIGAAHCTKQPFFVSVLHLHFFPNTGNMKLNTENIPLLLWLITFIPTIV